MCLFSVTLQNKQTSKATKNHTKQTNKTHSNSYISNVPVCSEGMYGAETLLQTAFLILLLLKARISWSESPMIPTERESSCQVYPGVVNLGRLTQDFQM